MPELPEVETTRRGIAPYLLGQRISKVVLRQPRLRWPVPADLGARLRGQRITAINRRAKYLLLACGSGHLIIHLGMSGSLRIHQCRPPMHGPHDHVDIHFGAALTLRYTDPRRFGAMLFTDRDPSAHPLLASLGPEPLGEHFDAAYLYARSRGRSVCIKSLLMNAAIVVGVGNIYANEALYRAGIRPQRRSGALTRRQCSALVTAVREVLEEAVLAGGTTLRDFVGGDGRPGYFRAELSVYGRSGQACCRCGTTLKELRIAQRSSVYCSACQT